mmetsp:Transcript_4477/g.11060  ORF Transcript_4477/g.11060 Transcript_4477/m.11060 type:complete len:555 (-) Transcript_4477:462-2126(-)|eukprot:CAMPEP_0177629132 /NCGR_PEP_ID=MMETSP0447-20121125/505_1 /TAXON_ID=0 /ORGANISM="Stygamoeba regulata, Strain BSH-02190019" /LENGTH=554 /DNA_ID=CAMNT_0019130433 /DNA_START=183 /DNA_END=1847 /DNA_ORIENTATION=-
MRRAGFILSTLSALAAVLCVCTGQLGRCELWAGEPSWCEPYLKRQVNAHYTQYFTYVPDVFGSQENMAANATGEWDVRLYAAPGGCRKAVQQLLCLSVFLQCADEKLVLAMGNSTSEFDLPRFPCKSVCLSVNQECDGLSGFEPVDCDQVQADLGQPLYPTRGTSIPTGGEPIFVPCYGDASQPPLVPLDDCPRAFGYSKEEDTCLPLCPDSFTIWSHSQRSIFAWFSLIVLVLSIPLMVFNLVPWLALPSKRKFPTCMPTVLGVSLLFVQIGFLTAFNPEVDDWACEGRFEIRSRNHWLCRVQAYVIIGFGTVITWAWSCILMNCTIPLFKPDFRWPLWMMGVEAALVVVPAAVILIIAEAKGWTGAMDPDLGFCVNGSQDQPQESLLLKAIPDAICISIGTLLIITLVILLAMHSFKVHGEAHGVVGSVRKFLKETYRTMVFCFCFWPSAAYGLGWEFYFFSRINSKISELEEYGECNVSRRDDCEAEDVVDWGTMLPFIFMSVCWPAVAFFMCFGLRGWVWKFWLSLLTGKLPEDDAGGTASSSRRTSGAY